MKKLIPIIIALVLIGVIVATSFGKQIYDKYSYGSDVADLNEYFKIYNSYDIPIILQDARIEESARLIDGGVYLDRATVEEYFTVRFYLDTNENLLLYTNAATTISSEIGSNVYVENGVETSLKNPLSVIKGETLYINIDYLKKFVNFSYELFENPYHMQVYTEWGEKTVADLNSDTDVRWRGGVKSEILTSVSDGDTVEILEVMDTWTKVKTKDAFIGYVENFRLSNERTEKETPVTEVPVEEYSCLTRDHKINLTWDYMEAPQDGTNLKETLKNVKALNVVSPTCYWLTDNDGNFKCIGNKNYVSTAHKMGIEVWGLVSNFHSNTNVDLTEVLSYTSKRVALEKNLVESVLSFEMDGINIDFESVPKACGEHYVQFIRELALLCHENNLILSVDNYVPSEYTAHYNRTEQGKFVDYIIIMGYDEHYAGSEAGSVSSIPWMTKGIEDTINLVPANKVINAIPFYTRVWKTANGKTTSEALTMPASAEWLTKNKLEPVWDEATSQNYAEITKSGTLYQVWMEDAQSIVVRLNVMNKNNIAGVASWRVGQEIPTVWELIAAYMGQ